MYVIIPICTTYCVSPLPYDNRPFTLPSNGAVLNSYYINATFYQLFCVHMHSPQVVKFCCQFFMSVSKEWAVIYCTQGNICTLACTFQSASVSQFAQCLFPQHACCFDILTLHFISLVRLIFCNMLSLYTVKSNLLFYLKNRSVSTALKLLSWFRVTCCETLFLVCLVVISWTSYVIVGTYKLL